jgi:DNA polymerase-3 subunit delta
MARPDPPPASDRSSEPSLVVTPWCWSSGRRSCSPSARSNASRPRYRASRPGAEMTDLDGATFDVGRFLELVSPSLFGGGPDGGRARPAGGWCPPARRSRPTSPTPSPDVVLVLMHDGAARGSDCWTRRGGAGAREISCARLTRLRRAGRLHPRRGRRGRWPEPTRPLPRPSWTRSARAARASAVARQLAFDSGGTVDVAVVARYHRGKADVKGWTVADRAIEGRLPAAMEELRWALSVAPSRCSSSALSPRPPLRRKGRQPDPAVGRRDRQGAGHAGVEGSPHGGGARSPAGPLTASRRPWVPSPQADIDVKGATAHPSYALERAVAAICAARAR